MTVSFQDQPDQKIAVVAMSGRFPEADSVDALWELLKSGHEAGQEFSVDQLEAVGFPRAVAERADFVRRRPLLNHFDQFDAGFFGFTPLEAEALDPQLRLLLQSAYHALEEAGGLGRVQRLRTGTFVGLRQSRYLDEHLMASPRHGNALGYDYMQMINRKDSAATLLSYKLDLGGPAISVNTACSTSLLAVHLACGQLLSYECDLALAGGAAIAAFGPDGIPYVPGGILSKDGRCRPFSADADGTIDGSAVAIVALKRYEDALRDGNRIHAVILASAANNDGADKVGYTAPSVGGQARVITEALGLSGISPDTIGYLEAHGTGTRLGDPIEIRALTQVYRNQTERRAYCHLGSIKANVGHLGAAAGVTGLIKAALVVREGVIPPLVNFSKANPALNLDSSPFVIPTEATLWPPQGTPRRAAVSSFGIGGTNVHAILEAGPAPTPAAPASAPSGTIELCLLSARSREAVQANAESVAAHLKGNSSTRLDDLAVTLAESRSHMPWRRFDVVDSVDALSDRWAHAAPLLCEPPRTRRRLAFLFPGQGSQHGAMAMGLYARWQPFRKNFDEISALISRHAGIDLASMIRTNDDAALRQTAVAQPALFAVSVALARTWQALGVAPDVLLGHSVGEIAAGCVAGIFSLEDAARLVCARGRLMQAAAPGTMLAVSLDATALARHLSGDGDFTRIETAVVNGRTACVAAGPAAEVERLQQHLSRAGVHTRALHTSHAFHTQAMDAAAQALAEVARAIDLQPCRIPVISSVTGTVLTDEQACSPLYWAQAVRQPVNFLGGLEALQAQGIDLSLEVGPGNTLSSLVRQDGWPWHAVTSLPHPSMAAKEPSGHADVRTFLRAAGELWAHAIPIDTDVLMPRREGYRQAHLPGYAFDRQRHWVEAGRPAGAGTAAASESHQAQTPWRRALLSPITLATVTPPAGSVHLHWNGTPTADMTAIPNVEGVADAQLADWVAHHTDQPVEAAVLATPTPSEPPGVPHLWADFDSPANRQALSRIVGKAGRPRKLLLLDGKPFTLLLDRVPHLGGAPRLRVSQVAGIPPQWWPADEDAPLAPETPTPGSTPLNLVRLFGPASMVTTTLQGLIPNDAAWLLLDEPDLPPVERLQRLSTARSALAAAGITQTTWLVLQGDGLTLTSESLARLLATCAAPLDGSTYVAAMSMLASADPSSARTEDLSKDLKMNEASVTGTELEDTKSDVSSTIRSIWARVLGKSDIGLDDNFFELGGNSLWALQIVSQVNTEFGCELHLSELLNSATVNALSALVEQRLLGTVDDAELQALLSELGDVSEEDVRRMLADMAAAPADGSADVPVRGEHADTAATLKA
jgi:phthiocerol/phenolphthiocerol synthesis type-I polyketide synthase E